ISDNRFTGRRTMSASPDIADGESGTVGTCATCGRPLTQVGSKGECLRCLASVGFLNDSQPSEAPGPRSRLVPGPMKYDHFEVEVGSDGFPIELGAGAMAITYRARDTILNSIVALKVIDRKVAQTPGARSRFLREARAAAQIRHPNVARVSHYGEQDGECFYVMELVEGETLEARVRREGPMPLAPALEIVEIDEAKRASDLSSYTTNNLDATTVRANLAVVYAWTGEIDLAISELDKLANRAAAKSRDVS